MPPNGPHVLSLFDDPPTAAAHEPTRPRPPSQPRTRPRAAPAT